MAVCFSAPVVELVRSPRTDHLGPDLCRPDAALADAVRRMGQIDQATPLADVLLDQRICCGVGNVYKSEVPFALGIHPLTPIGALDGDARRRVVATAARQLQANLTTSSRTTMPGPPGTKGVYGRKGEPCRRCGTNVEMARTGPQARSTSAGVARRFSGVKGDTFSFTRPKIVSAAAMESCWLTTISTRASKPCLRRGTNLGRPVRRTTG